jgi:UDP-glucose 4-epimerase
VTKAAAEDLCHLFYRNQRLPCVVLRTSRFFPEEDDNKQMRESYADENLKLNEYLFRRVDLEDVVSAHLLAAKRAPSLGFRRYIISATTPFLPDDPEDLWNDAPQLSESAFLATKPNMLAWAGECSRGSTEFM